VPEDLPPIKCRSQQIQQVVLNLLTNARDALNSRYEGFHDDKIIRLTAYEVEHDGGAWIRLTLEDHGIGIPAEILDLIFDPFFTTKPRDQGTGLGLSISYGIVRDHYGTLTVESGSDSGTRFTMELPMDGGRDLTATARDERET
jgi:signal transduction histidine kinase